uniref:Large ribosomal subunit protein uL4c n=1 Tax=Nitzschia sp. IriIs04 TaxID=1444690 RepID=A0A0S3QPR0_9STRA|nr:ribosomal protein L4 [Nitzschia sp. IriIs04]BAT70310.1 ribosomal protein L4 [Nitzschia sp. IriIs04]
MSITKKIKFNIFDINGIWLTSKNIELTILSKTGNYLIFENYLKFLKLKKNYLSSTKTKSEVKGGGRKPWKQKGLGRARVGSIRSPLWRGGGITFGPKPKKISLKINKKEKQLALQILFYNRKNNILIIKDIENHFNEIKTKNCLKLFNNFNIDINKKILIIVSKNLINLKLSVKNLKNVKLVSFLNLNVLNLLKYKQIIMSLSSLDLLTTL